MAGQKRERVCVGGNQSQKSFDLISFIGNNHKRFRFPGLMKNAIDLEVGRCNSSETERAGSESGLVSTFWGSAAKPG